VRIHPEISDALDSGGAVVALESTIISHGLPRPDNLRVAREIEDTVRSAGAVPATIAIVDGEARLGLDQAALERIASSDDVAKASIRDLPVIAARRGQGATTVAATAHLAAQAGITVFATGGVGGVHRYARESWDESADLTTLSRLGVLVVCAGIKSILDVPATLERLETLGICVIGYRTSRFPGFYRADSGSSVDWRVESPAEVAQILRARRELGLDDTGLVLANPIPVRDELDKEVHDAALVAGLAAAEHEGIHGKDVTPFLLEHFHRTTKGASLDANVALVLANARLAAEVAVADADLRR
jgi:pseudouridine-5'-phosphate glycosidase